MRNTYVNRRFLDYAVPVLVELNRIPGVELSVLYSKDAIPERVEQKLIDGIGRGAIGLTGEHTFGRNDTRFLANQVLSIQYQPGLYRTILETMPDVVVGYGLFKWSAIVYGVRLFQGIPMVMCYERTAHTERHAQWYRKLYRKLVIRRSGAMCCNGTLSAKYIVSLGMPEQRIFIGQMAADTENLADQAKRTTPSEIDYLRNQWNIDGVFFLYVGQLIPRKGILELLSGWKKFEQQEDGFTSGTLVLVGDGPQRHEIESYCSANDLRRVRWTGAVNYSNIAKWYAAADVFIIPTLEDNWSLVVPEAMACGLPVACSKYNGCWPELVHPEKNGWLFDPSNVNETVSLLRHVGENKERLSTMGEQSIRIVQDFTPKKAAYTIFRACRHAIH